MDPARALGLLIVGAIDHLTSRPHCCPYCCAPCAGLSFYWDKMSETVSETAVALALGDQTVNWRLSDGKINWPYLVLFWNTPDDHVCA